MVFIACLVVLCLSEHSSRYRRCEVKCPFASKFDLEVKFAYFKVGAKIYPIARYFFNALLSFNEYYNNSKSYNFCLLNISMVSWSVPNDPLDKSSCLNDMEQI